MTTGKTISLTRQTFVGKVMSLLLNMLSRLVITFLPRSKHLLILWLKSPSAVILEPPKIVWHSLHCFLIYYPWSDGEYYITTTTKKMDVLYENHSIYSNMFIIYNIFYESFSLHSIVISQEKPIFHELFLCHCNIGFLLFPETSFIASPLI